MTAARIEQAKVQIAQMVELHRSLDNEAAMHTESGKNQLTSSVIERPFWS